MSTKSTSLQAILLRRSGGPVTLDGLGAGYVVTITAAGQVVERGRVSDITSILNDALPGTSIILGPGTYLYSGSPIDTPLAADMKVLSSTTYGSTIRFRPDDASTVRFMDLGDNGRVEGLVLDLDAANNLARLSPGEWMHYPPLDGQPHLDYVLKYEVKTSGDGVVAKDLIVRNWTAGGSVYVSTETPDQYSKSEHFPLWLRGHRCTVDNVLMIDPVRVAPIRGQNGVPDDANEMSYCSTIVVGDTNGNGDHGQILRSLVIFPDDDYWWRADGRNSNPIFTNSNTFAFCWFGDYARVIGNHARNVTRVLHRDTDDYVGLVAIGNSSERCVEGIGLRVGSFIIRDILIGNNDFQMWRCLNESILSHGFYVDIIGTAEAGRMQITGNSFAVNPEHDAATDPADKSMIYGIRIDTDNKVVRELSCKGNLDSTWSGSVLANSGGDPSVLRFDARDFDAPAYAELAGSATLDTARNKEHILTLTADSTIDAFAPVQAGTSGVLHIRQDATGGHSLAFGPSFTVRSGDLTEVAGADSTTIRWQTWDGANINLYVNT